jgi:hypothetical protein
VSAAWHSHQISRLRILEQLDLLFGICNRVDDIVGSLEDESATELKGRIHCFRRKPVVTSAGLRNS